MKISDCLDVACMKTNRMRMLFRAVKKCHGDAFRNYDMNSKDYSVVITGGYLNGRLYIFKTEVLK